MSGFPPTIALLTADAPGIASAFLGLPQWGIFSQNGAPILVSNNVGAVFGRVAGLAFGGAVGGAVTQAVRDVGFISQVFGLTGGLVDSVGEVEYRREYDVSNYPQEGGPGVASAFESYNKVQIPYEAKVTILTNLTRRQILAALEPIIATLQLVTVVMPEWGYQSANLTSYNFRRTVRSGVTLIAVEVGCKEIRYGNSMLTSSATPQTQQLGGTDRPVGQVNVKVPATGQESGFGGATDTASTNAAYPTQSGPVQAQSPAESSSSTPTHSYVTPLAPF